MNRNWLILAVPLLLLMALGVANARTISLGWKVSTEIPITQPKEKIKSIFAAIQGRSDAQEDIRKGHLMLKAWGLAPMNAYTYEEVLEHRLGVRMKTVAGCVVWPSQIAGWNAYNAEMQAEIDRRFGPHAMTTVETEAHALNAARDSGQAWFEAFKFAGDGAHSCGAAYDAASYARVYDCGQRMLAEKKPFYGRFEPWIDHDPFNGPPAVYAYDGHMLVVIPKNAPPERVRSTHRLRGMRANGVLFGVALN